MRSAFNNPALSAALLKGPGSVHKQSQVTEEKRMENAWVRSRSSEASLSNRFSIGADKLYAGAESLAKGLGVPERLTQSLTHARQEREDSRGIAGQIRSTTQDYLAENQEAAQAEDTASNYRMASANVGLVGKAVTKAASITGAGAVATAAASSAISAGLSYRGGQFAEKAAEGYAKTGHEAYEAEHGGERASGDEMFKRNISSELVRGNAAQGNWKSDGKAGSAVDNIKRHPGSLGIGLAAGAISKSVGGGIGGNLLGEGFKKAVGVLRGAVSEPDQNKVQARSSNAEAARNAQVLARSAGHQNPRGASYQQSGNPGK